MVPRMFDEPLMPPYEMVLQRLLVSTIPDWPTVSKWDRELSLPRPRGRHARHEADR